MASRSPVPGVGYDQSLLAAAPEVTKADKQEGYNPDLLEQGTPTRGPTSRRTPVSLPANGKYNGSDESNGVRKAALPAAAPATKGRPKKLMWIIGGVVLLVIIAVAVGVGVGVGAKKGNGNNGTIVPTGPSPTDTSKTDEATQTAATTESTGASQGAVAPSGINDGSNGSVPRPSVSNEDDGVVTATKPI